MKKTIYIFFTILVSICLITGCGKKNDKVDKEKEEVKKEETFKIENKDNMFYVNGNKVDLYSEYADKNLSEEEFYKAEKFKYKYEVVSDILYLEIELTSNKEALFVNKEGKIIKNIDDLNLSLKSDKSDLNTIVTYDVSKVEDNSIYIKVRRFYDSAACTDVLDNKENSIYSTIDKITYLGENKFKVEKAVNDTITSGDFVKSNGGIDFCLESKTTK